MDPEQMLELLSEMEAKLSDMDVTQAPHIMFLQALKAELESGNHGNVEPTDLNMILEYITLDISEGVDPKLLERFALGYARMLTVLLGNPSFQALDPVLRRTALKSITFSYKT